MLTIKNCTEHVRDELKAEALDPALSFVWLINETGHALANARGWNWMKRHASLNLTGSQSYVDLSGLVSFRHDIAFQVAQGYLRPTDFGAIQEWRLNGVGSSSFPTYYAIVPNTSAAGVVSYRCELWGTPSATVPNGLACYYQGGFQAHAEDAAETDRVAVPDWFEGLFVTALRITAKGRVHGENASIEARWESLRGSALWRDAVVRDSLMQSNFGTVRNGAVAVQLTSFPTRRMPSSV